MVQAAVQGLVDFSAAEPFNGRWRRHLRLQLWGLEKQNQRALRQLKFSQAVAILTCANLQAEKLDAAAERADELYAEIRKTYYPGETQNKLQYEKAQIKAEITDWTNRFGDLKNAEVQERMSKFAEAMERLRQDTAKKAQQDASSPAGYVGRQMGLDPARLARRKK